MLGIGEESILDEFLSVCQIFTNLASLYIKKNIQNER